MDASVFDAIKQWFVDNETFLSAITALAAIASGAYIALRQAFGVVSNRRAAVAGGGSVPISAAPSKPEQAVDGKPTTAVLPFRTLSAGDQEKYLAEGIAEDIIVNLSYSRLFPVVSSATSFRFRNSEKSLAEIGDELGAQYLVTGTIAKVGDRLRITVELDDCTNGKQLWSDRYTRTNEDIFELQEEIADVLVAKLDPALRAEAINRARRTPPHSRKAWEHALKGLWHYNKYERLENETAIAEFKAAIECDNEFAHAYSMLALALYMRSYLGWSDDPLNDMILAGQNAQSAVHIDPDLAEGYLILTYNALMTHKFDLAEQHAQRALDLNPCSGHCWLGIGLVSLYRGHHTVAAEHFERVERLNPNDPVRWLFRVAAALAAMMEGEYEQALQHAAIAGAQHQGKQPSELITCAALVALGREQEAAAIVAQRGKEKVLEKWPQVLSRMPFEDSRKLDFLIELVARIEPDFSGVTLNHPKRKKT
jgi:TolB-like protein